MYLGVLFRPGGKVGLALTVAAAGTTSAQRPNPTDETLPTLRIVRTDSRPTIDGRLDDAVWSQAAVIDDFHQLRPVDQGPPSERTEIYLLYDDDALYIAGRFFETDPSQISANILKQKTGLRDDDRLAVVIDPFNTRRSGYRFELNPNGVRLDALYENVRGFNLDWDGIWEGTSTIDEQGWTTELAIPFKTLSFDPNSDTWGFNFGRAIRRRAEEDAWVSRNRNYNPSVVGLITGFTGMDQGLGLDIVPSISAIRSRAFDPGDDDTDLEPSLDLFYKLTPSLNAALTINTDFSATEVDDRQVNLTRFSLFFPERRAFFLQDTDIFEFGNIGGSDQGGRGNTATDRPSQENARPFFSRRLGLSATGEPVDLNYGGKISGRIGRWTIGNLLVRQDEFADVAASDVFVGRATANVLGESAVGVIVTDGDPNSLLDNSLYGADFRYLNTRLPGGRLLEGEAWYQQSDTTGVVGEESAYGLGLRMPNSAGLRAGFSIKDVEANFNPALGFVSRSGVRDQTVDVGYTRFTGGGFIQQIFGGVDFQQVDFLSGGLQSEKIAVTPLELQSRGRDTFFLRYIDNKEVVTAPFMLYRDSTRQVDVPIGTYSFERYGFDIETGSQRKISGNLTYRGGGFYGGDRLHFNSGVSWKPSKHYSLAVNYEWNDIELPQGEFITRLVQITSGWTFSSKLSWVTLWQYDNLSEVLGINSRLHWIPEEGREAFIVLNHNVQDFDKDNSFVSTTSELTLKFDYTFRF